MRFSSLCLAALLSLAATGAMASTADPCLGTSDTAQRYVQVVRNQVFLGDSVRVVAMGLPFKPSSGVALEADSTACAAVVSAFNGMYPPADSAKHIAAGYVIRVGNQAYAFVRPKADYDGPTSYFFFDANYNFLIEIS